MDQDIKLQRWEVKMKKTINYETKNDDLDIYEFFKKGINGKCGFPVVTTNGMACEASHQAMKLGKMQRLITNTAFGEMGKGLPMAIGACVANGKNPVICMEGDGSIMMNIQELQTMKHHNLPLKIFLFNNGVYYSIRNTMKSYFGKVFAADSESGVSVPNWKKLIEGFGVKYEKIKSKRDLYKIGRILNFDGPIFCELVIDPEQKMLPKWNALKYRNG